MPPNYSSANVFGSAASPSNSGFPFKAPQKSGKKAVKSTTNPLVQDQGEPQTLDPTSRLESDE